MNEMKNIVSIGCAITLCVSFISNVNAASVDFSSQLDLTNLQYPVVINTISGNAAADIVRFDLGTGWAGEMEILLGTSNYSDITTALGFALTTDPNDVLFANPDTFLQLVNSPTTTTEFFNANVNGWVFYGWGSNIITAGGITDLTAAFTPALEFNPTAHYYAFIAGGSVAPVTVDVNLTVNSISAVPVPAAIWLFGSGLLGLLGMGYQKKVWVIKKS